MGKRHEYEGGAWAIGSAAPHPRPSTAIDAAQRRREVAERLLPFAEARAAETGRRLYRGIADFYRAELATLDRMIEAREGPEKGQAASAGQIAAVA